MTNISYSIVNEKLNNGKTQLGNLSFEEISFAVLETSVSSDRYVIMSVLLLLSLLKSDWFNNH